MNCLKHHLLWIGFKYFRYIKKMYDNRQTKSVHTKRMEGKRLKLKEGWRKDGVVA
jgi:hypothetical protein